MNDLASVKKKSIFAHKQTYSQKGNSKSLSIRAIIDELERMEGACPHVLEPQTPTVIEGMQPSALHDQLVEQFTARNRELRKMRKEFPDRKGNLRAIRQDTHILVAAVYSYPDSVADMDEAEYQAWRDDVITFAKRDAERNVLEVMTVVEHRDEAHPHLHILSVPLITQANPRMNAKLCHEGHVEQDKHTANGWSGSPSRSYKKAMRDWQDRYHQDVGSKHRQARTGPKRRRMDRATWKAEQTRIVLLKDVEKAERRAQNAASRAEAAEAQEQATALRSAALRLHEAEVVQRLADEGLIEALRAVNMDDRLISRLAEQIEPRGYSARNADENQILRETVVPVFQEGLKMLQDFQAQGNAANRFEELVTFVVGWTQHLVEVMPRWLRWGELVDRITRSAQQAFGWTYRPDTLAGIVEASPVWQDIETEAERELKRAQDIAALSAHHGNPHQVERGFGFQFEAD